MGLKTSIKNFNAFVRCALMGNQPWPQFQNGIRERSIMKLPKIFINFLSSQVTINLEIMENLQSKSFMSYIEIVNKLALKETLGHSIMKKPKRPGD